MKRFIFATICILGGLFFGSTVLALSVSPVRIETAGDPGKIVRGEISLINEYNGTKTFYSSFENFEATGETGTPAFIEGEQGLATWIETTPQITLEPGKQKKVPYAIHIPKDADPGGYFAAIFWSTSPPKSKEGGAVSIAAKVGILVLLKVTGEIEEGVGLLEFSTENNKKFFDALPINFIFRFKNSGGDRVKPAGEITIKNMLGRVAAVLPANKSDGNVLPQSIRRFETIWEKVDEDEDKEKKIETETDEKGFIQELKREKDNFAFGRYTAELNLKHGAEKIQSSFSFFVIPWRILSLVILILALTLFGFIRGMRRYNKWIITKAKIQA